MRNTRAARRLREAARGGEDRSRARRSASARACGRSDRRSRRRASPPAAAATSVTDPRSGRPAPSSTRSALTAGSTSAYSITSNESSIQPRRAGDERAPCRRVAPVATSRTETCGRQRRAPALGCDHAAMNGLGRAAVLRPRGQSCWRPCARRVAVHADRVDVQLDRAPHRRSGPCVSTAIRTARATTASRSWMTAPGLVAASASRRARRRDRRNPPRDAQAGGLARASSSSEPGRPNRTAPESNARNGPRDRVGQRAVARRHVVERAVRLHVPQRHPFGAARSPPARRSGRARSLRLRGDPLQLRACRIPAGRGSLDARRRRRRRPAPAGPCAA